MNKSKLKSYAPQARKDFIAAVTAHANLLGLSEAGGTLEVVPTSKITHLPKDVHYADAAVKYNATYTLKGNTLTLKRELTTQNTSMVCGEAEYELDKKFYPVFQRDLRAQVLYE